MVYSVITEPSNAKEAMLLPQWKVAMEDEYIALMRNTTWSIMPQPANRTLIGLDRFIKVKLNPDGSLNKYKARLVSQVVDFDFHETFSPVAKQPTIRILLNIALSKGWSIR